MSANYTTLDHTISVVVDLEKRGLTCTIKFIWNDSIMLQHCSASVVYCPLINYVCTTIMYNNILLNLAHFPSLSAFFLVHMQLLQHKLFIGGRSLNIDVPAKTITYLSLSPANYTQQAIQNLNCREQSYSRYLLDLVKYVLLPIIKSTIPSL